MKFITEMTNGQARMWISLYSLFAISFILIFLFVSPTMGYPIDYEGQVPRLTQILIPVLLGYLTSAARFVFGNVESGDDNKVNRPIFGVLLIATMACFTILLITGISVFGYANIYTDEGLDFEILTWFLTVAIGMLAVVTNVATLHLFKEGQGSA